MRFLLAITALVFGLALALLAASLIVARGQHPAPNRIAFISERGGFYGVYTMTPDGSGVQRLAFDGGGIPIAALWSPRGDWIAVVTLVKGGLTQLHLVRPFGPAEYPVGQVRDSRSVAWSPDGRWIAFSALSRPSNPLIGWDVYRMDPGGRTVKRLIDALFAKLGAGASSYEQPAWSPDGQWIAVCAEVGDLPGIYVLRRDGRTARRLERGCTPTWSPDGQWIAFTRHDNTGHLVIYRMRPDGSETQALADTPGSTEAPLWSPDGEWVVFASAGSAGDRALYRMRADGSRLERVTDDPVVGTFGWSPDGEWIVYAAITGGREPDLYRIRPDGTGKQRLTDDPGADYNPTWARAPDKPFWGGVMLGLGLALVAAGMHWFRTD